MKNLFTIFLIVLATQASATPPATAGKYYFSASGNDANSGAIGSPWATVAKFNATTFLSTDSVFFNRGDVWYGSLAPKTSGIYIGAYGTGAKPKFTGFTTVTGMSASSGGRYSKVISNLKFTLNIVCVDGQPQEPARYPNSNTTNGGYLTHAGGDTTFIKGVVTGQNFVGRKVAIKLNDWTIQTAIVWKQSHDTIWFRRFFDIGKDAAARFDTPKPAYGYFFYNDSLYADRLYEWALDSATKKLSIYGNPSGHLVQVPTIDTGINVGGKTGIKISNLNFEGFGQYGVAGFICSNITIDACDFTNIGWQGVGVYRGTNLVVTNCSFTNIMSLAIYDNSQSVVGANLSNNRITNIGIIKPLGSFNQGSAQYNGIYLNVLNTGTCNYNVFKNIGLAPIRAYGSILRMNYNKADSGCLSLQDNAFGVYMFTGNNTGKNYTDREIANNFFSYGIGTPEGTAQTTTPRVAGIYLDDSAMNVNAHDNVIKYSNRNGIHLNNVAAITLRNNILYNNKRGVSTSRFNNENVSGLNIKKNVIYSRTAAVNNYFTIANLSGQSVQTAVRSMGMIDSNYENNTTGRKYQVESYTSLGVGYKIDSSTLTNWRVLSLFDIGTKALTTAATDTLLENYSAGDSTFALAGLWRDRDSNIFTNTVTLSAYTGKLMFYVGPYVPPTTPISLSLSKVNVLCKSATTASITSTVSGGTSPYSYHWTGPGGYSSTLASPTGLGAGDYSLTVTDAATQTAGQTITITEPTLLSATATAGTLNDSLSLTSVIVSASGGVMPYDSTGVYANVGPGLFTKIVIDANGCPATASVNVIVTPAILPTNSFYSRIRFLQH